MMQNIIFELNIILKSILIKFQNNEIGLKY